MPTTTLPKGKKKKPGSLVGSNTNGNAGNFTESAMDEFLVKQGLYRKPIAKDGSCLFRAVSEQIYNCQERHLDVRNQCIDFLRRNRNQFEEFVEGPFDHHLFKLKNPKEWAGQVEITALSQMYRKDFVVYQDINVSPTKVTDHGYKDRILLCYSNGNHYDIIYSHQFQEHAAMCQSLLFEMLYNKVFTELEKKEAGKKGKAKVTGNQGNQKTIIDFVNGSMAGEDGDLMDNGSDDDGWTEVKSKARVKHERHSKSAEIEEEKDPEDSKTKTGNDQKYLWELRRSIDPHLYRNISLEIWEEGKHLLQQKDMTVAASLQFKNGEQCSVKLGPPTVPTEKTFSAIIKEDYGGSGSILVYVHELKERHTVPVQCVSSQQNPSYKDLSGHYQKDFSANGPSGEEGKDDGKFKKKRLPRNNRRGPGVKVDEPGVGNEEVVLPRGRGKPRERYNRRRFPGGKEDRFAKDMKEEEEARFIAEQIKLVELQEKDPTAFPALPVRQGNQSSLPSTQTPLPAAKPDKIESPVSPSKEEYKMPEIEKDRSSASEDTPAGFWSKLNKKKSPQKPSAEEIKSPPVARPQETQPAPTIKTEEKEEEIEVKDIEAEPVTKKENDMVNVPEKEIIGDEKSVSSLEQETVKCFQEPLQIKPVSDDSQHSRGGHVFEVKIPEQATDLLKPTNITPVTLVRSTKEPVKETPQIKQEAGEDVPENVEKGKDSEEKMQEEVMVEFDDNDMEDKEPLSSKKINLQLASSHLVKESYKGEQPVYTADETVVKSLKVRAGESNVVPEKKTVTFAEETKEIPDVPYGQSQKGILVVNGTNRQEQSYKQPNIDDNSAIKDNQKQDFMSIHDNQDKDHQMFPSFLPSEGLQSSSPTTQQQQPAHLLYYLPQNVQLPARHSVDPTGADLPQDIPTLRHFFNLGYQYYMMTTSQLANQQLPFIYMYPGAMQEQMMQQPHQPVVSLPQQQMYSSLQHQHVTYQHHGIQPCPGPFHMAPQATQDTTSQLERPNERTNQHQSPIQPQPQIQMPHQQQSGHFHSQQNQMNWRTGPNPGMTGNNRHYNKIHNVGPHPHRQQWSQGTGGNQRQQHPNSKPNRKPQGSKMRNDHGGYSPHYSSSSHSPSMSHSVSTPYHSVPGDHQTKVHNQGDFYPQVPYGYHAMQPGMQPNLHRP